jgi:hypothetical protein
MRNFFSPWGLALLAMALIGMSAKWLKRKEEGIVS